MDGSIHLEHIPGSFGLSSFISANFTLGTKKGVEVIALNVVVTLLAPSQIIPISKSGARVAVDRHCVE